MTYLRVKESFRDTMRAAWIERLPAVEDLTEGSTATIVTVKIVRDAGTS